MKMFDFEKTRCLFLDSISKVLESDPFIISILLSANNTAQIGETEKKTVWDQAFRDRCLNDSTNFSTPLFEKLLQLSLDCAVALLCSPTLPVILLTDTLDILPLVKCEEIFNNMVENRVSIWKQGLFFNLCKDILLRLCNDLLRRLSRSQNTVFCGRILLFLAKFFPFSERSGLNLAGEFNLDHFTILGARKVTCASERSANSKHKDAKEVKESLTSDYNLNKKLWSLQEFFQKPNQCYKTNLWKTFCLHTNDVLSAFSTIKLDERRNRSNWDKANIDANEITTNSGNVKPYFAKYSASQNLLELQLGHSNFRRYILLQFLIMFQYLDSPVKFKLETHKLSIEQTTWISETIDKVYWLLIDTPPDGASFVQSIRHILKRENLWNDWKNDGCQEFQPNIALATDNEIRVSNANEGGETILVHQPRRIKPSLGDVIREASKTNDTMDRSLNLCHENMAACRSKERDFLPSVKNYFEEAIKQLDPLVESQFKKVNEANFQWRALRLLARRRLHFFTLSINRKMTPIPDFLEAHIRKLAKDKEEVE